MQIKSHFDLATQDHKLKRDEKRSTLARLTQDLPMGFNGSFNQQNKAKKVTFASIEFAK